MNKPTTNTSTNYFQLFSDQIKNEGSRESVFLPLDQQERVNKVGP